MTSQQETPKNWNAWNRACKAPLPTMVGFKEPRSCFSAAEIQDSPWILAFLFRVVFVYR